MYLSNRCSKASFLLDTSFLDAYVDYEEIYGKYLDKIIAYNPVDEEDYAYQRHYLERWCRKFVPQILEMGRPDAAYTIAMQVLGIYPIFWKRKSCYPITKAITRKFAS